MRFLVAVLLGTAAAVPASANDRLQVGGMLGVGVQQEMFGSGDPSGVVLGTAEAAFGAGLAMADNRPRFQVVMSIMGGQSFTPSSRYVHGGLATFRLHLAPTRPFGYYTEIGAGVTSSGLKVRELNGWMQYYLLLGGGARWTRGNVDLLLGYRLTHLSNNGTSPPNRGLNMHTAVVGVMYTLR
ncbi:MAG TPA: acyloxyacyl hydrolase [Candidatus Paceibacterota bacterium]|nr:acyloxyacyl hydrolase [Candidatus Paceibacterota bacterium]